MRTSDRNRIWLARGVPVEKESLMFDDEVCEDQIC